MPCLMDVSFPLLEPVPLRFFFASSPGEVTATVEYMYRSIAAATTFSPRFLAVLSEAGRAADYFGAPLQLIHVGEETAEKQERFANGLEQFRLPADTPIHWLAGEPARVISERARSLGSDLVVAGAIQSEQGYRPFANDISKQLLAEAPLDLFLFLRPREEAETIKNPAVLIDFSATSAEALKQTIKLAKKNRSEKIVALHMLTTFEEHRLNSTPDAIDPEDKLDQFVLAHTELEIPVETIVVRGNTGFSLCQYVQESEIDLFVVTTGMPGVTQPVLSAQVEWLSQVIPCNVWVIRERATA